MIGHPMVRLSAGMLVLGLALGYGVRAAGPQLTAIGPPDGAHLSAAAMEDAVFRVRVTPAGALDGAELRLDGQDVTRDARIVGNEISYRPPRLRDGEHNLRLAVTRPFVPWSATREWNFTIDRVRPEITVRDRSIQVAYGQPVLLRGRVSENDVTLTADGEPVPVRGGEFSLQYDEPPAAPITLRTTDLAGNTRGIRVAVQVTPRPVPEPVRSVHITAIGWDTPSLRDPVMRLVDEGVITAVQLDLKDESGVVGYDSAVPRALAIGAVQPSYDLEEAVRAIHARGGRVIGRIVAFRDPILTAAAWDAGERDQVIQTPDGQPYAQYGGFANFANPEVRAYNKAIAVEAARAGVDEILWDYIRRPDGPLDSMRFPGLKGGAQASVAGFLGETRKALEPTGTFQGASLFGVAANRPEEIAQNVPKISRNVDYIAPLIYPSHWSPGEFGVADPERQPAKIIEESLRPFVEQARGTGARVVPWLQDFSLAVPYGPREIRAQIEGARRAGIIEWIFWDPFVTYTADGMRGGAAPAP